MSYFLSRLHVVFGHVIDGEDVVTKIESQRTDAKNRPLVEVTITNCGELVLKVIAKGRWLIESTTAR